jgi:tRNA uridine 5-carboxymethylaminomethyl modification enzyme
MNVKYDCIVVGAGHAGCEAADAIARRGLKCLLITTNLDRVAWASCNPAFGGPGKTQMISEIDALGGIMPKIIDKTCIQIRKLNESRGPAVWAYRAQIDKVDYARFMSLELQKYENLDFMQSEVAEIFFDQRNNGVFVIKGLKTDYGVTYEAQTFVVTTGTFLKGKILTGSVIHSAGRQGDKSAEYLSESLSRLGLRLGRLKTGTPPRIDRRTINFEELKEEKSEPEPHWFNIENEYEYKDITNFLQPQKSCFLTYSNQKTHSVLINNKNNLPLYNGQIESMGPRYCPSFEAKVINFPDKARHPLFLEPEGKESNEIYLQGANTSAPPELQVEFIRTIKGLEEAKIMRWGYAIEYDFIFPTQLKNTLELKNIENLFLAGQINGTTGYEEAGAQGIIAGINASKKVLKEEPFYLNRLDAYIGILVDDLITKDYIEPYRMFTARSEMRLHLRCFNAHLRLNELAFRNNLISEQRFDLIKNLEKEIEDNKNKAKTIKVKTQDHTQNNVKQVETLVKNGVWFDQLSEEIQKEFKFTVPTSEIETYTQIYYEGYLKDELRRAGRLLKNEEMNIPEDFDYTSITPLRTEAKQRLAQVKPQTIGQASRINGVMSADLQVLTMWVSRNSQVF